MNFARGCVPLPSRAIRSGEQPRPQPEAHYSGGAEPALDRLCLRLKIPTSGQTATGAGSERGIRGGTQERDTPTGNTNRDTGEDTPTGDTRETGVDTPGGRHPRRDTGDTNRDTGGDTPGGGARSARRTHAAPPPRPRAALPLAAAPQRRR